MDGNKFMLFGAVLICFIGGSFAAAPKRDNNDRPYKLVCYWGTWSVYRPGEGMFDINNIDVNLCTHLVYTFAGLGFDYKIQPLDAYLDLEENWGRGYFKKFNQLKHRNPRLTTILAIGGWNEGSIKYSIMADDPVKRSTFVQSVVTFLLRHGFDGLDLDWEYPSNRDGRPQDKENFVLLLRELRTAFDQYGFLLTGAVSAGKDVIDSAYIVPKIFELFDFVNVMAYDYHGDWNTTTGHFSPLYVRPSEKYGQETLNVDFSIKYWLKLGAKPEKLVLGLPTYGRSFTLIDRNNNDIGAPARGAGVAGPYTRQPGVLGFNEICSMQRSGDWTVKRDAFQQTPYAFNGDQWVGYDDETSIALKTDYAKNLKLAGIMIWSLETDDFWGRCSGVQNPLLKKIIQRYQ